MKQFLKLIAQGYTERYDDISRLTFIMPNKRSGTFLLKALSELSDTPVLGPRILPINDFIAEVADSVEDSRIDMLFRLYECYRSLSEAEGMSFEKFISWGETILSDFNEVDMQMVEADELFKNVYDLNAIRSNFLSDEQRKVMVDYFGYSRNITDTGLDRFWQSFEDKEKGGVRKKFHALWEQLNPLYRNFKENLNKDGLTSGGGAYREAAEKIEAGYEPFPGEKIVFVGFNALSMAENTIFRALKQMTVDLGRGEEPKADFIWDKVSPVLASKDDPAVRFVNINSRKENFPSPPWIAERIERSIPVEAPESLKVIAVPSNVMQTKIAGEELKKMAGSVSGKEIENARIAVVLPDENLLLPLLYSLPEEFTNPNLTMGFPLRQTPVISFATLLKRLQQGGRKSDKGSYFLIENVKEILAHPYAHILFEKEKISTIISRMEKARRVVVASNTLEELGENSALIFRVLDDSQAPLTVIDYIFKILREVKNRISLGENKSYVPSRIELTYIDTYIDSLFRLSYSLREYDFAISAAGVFSLAHKLTAGETVVFEGKPLEGLQIMGVLETRCLDFDRIIMLSVNEKSMPKVGRNTSFIPNNIRTAFGMPPANYQEEIFAYYFFRVLSRCRHGILTYDSRSSENRTPGPSRYLLQMKYLAPALKILETEVAFGMPSQPEGDITIPKTGDITVALKRYGEEELPEGVRRKNFSASSLSHYFRCPVQFLYNDVLELGEEPEIIESINAIDLGSIVHKIIERLYFPEEKRKKVLDTPIVMTREKLQNLLDENTGGTETLIEKEARKAILEIHFKMDEEQAEKGQLRGSPAILHEYIVKYVSNIIEADIRQAPLRLWGSEVERTVIYPLPNGKNIRLKMIIDRLDQEGGEGAPGPFRIIDYKTGRVHLDAENFEEIFDGTINATNIFQLLLYAELLLQEAKKGKLPMITGHAGLEDFERNLKIAIYKIINLPDLSKGIVVPKIGKKPAKDGKEKKRKVENMAEFRLVEIETGQTFRERLDGILQEILDENHPFTAEPTEERCLYCDFKLRCEMLRAKKEEKN